MHLYDLNLFWTCLAAIAGGYVGMKMKIPAGALIGALVATVIVRSLEIKPKEIPYLFGFLAQVFIGLLIGSGVSWKTFEELSRCWLPLLVSGVGIVLVGILFAVVITKVGFLDFPTSFLGTSPGAMSAMILVGLEYGANGAIVGLFHFFRIIVVLLTVPLVMHFLGKPG